MPFKFESLEVWQLAIEYIDTAYDITQYLPRDEDFNLKSQLRRAATSVALNIAEGSTGQSDPEQVHFLGYALRSLIETVACQKLIERRKYPVEATLRQQAISQATTLVRKIQAMRKALKRSSTIGEDSAEYTAGLVNGGSQIVDDDIIED